MAVQQLLLATGGTTSTAPANIVAPVISGTTTVGQTLSATNGTWTGTPTPTFAYQWNRGGTNISGATASTYLLVSADLAATITVTVTATNTAGNASATSAGAGPIAAATSANASQFLNRTSGLDTTHTNAYIALIDGLTTDGVWSKLDVLHVYATQDSTTALLNLKSSSYTGIANGSPTFTADRCFTGVDTSATVYINTQFNPATATSPQFVQNSAHISEWALNNIAPASGNHAIGAQTSGSAAAFILPQYSGQTYFQLNSASYNAFPTGTSVGHYLSNRSASNAIQQYKNGSSIQVTGDASVAVVNSNFYTLASNNSGAAVGAGYQLCMFSIGSSLSSTDVTNFYNRLRTYMTVVGVP